MGVGDLRDERPRKVTTAEWVQHMLRYHWGQFVNGMRGHRVVWAMVNSMLLEEAGGKGFAVHRNVMRREGGRLRGGEGLTREGLRRMLDDEDMVRRLVHELMTVGKDVRSTPMQWAYEGKRLDWAVKHLSWRPPWVRGEDHGAGEDEEVDRLCKHRVVDRVGLGRISTFWWTLNCPYNYAYDVHRLNVSAQQAAEAVSPGRDVHRGVRYAFARDCPDVVAYAIALRTELHMKMVMPSVVPHSEEAPYLSMGRFECGSGGNPQRPRQPRSPQASLVPPSGMARKTP